MTWQGWINFVVGLWVIITPFLGMSMSSLATNLVVSGIIVAVLSLWEEFQYKDIRMHVHG